jgi:hypothetical protein
MNAKPLTRRITTTLAATLALGLALPALSAVCEDVTFTVKNEHSTGKSIKIKKVKYRDITADASNLTENVVDYTCGFGKTCTSHGDDLGTLVSGRLAHRLTNIQFLYQYKEADGDWSDAVWSKKFAPTDEECRNNRDYGSSDWVITG